MNNYLLNALFCFSLAITGCYRLPGKSDYQNQPDPKAPGMENIRFDGFYYLNRDEEGQYVNYVLKYYPDGTALLTPFGSDSTRINPEAWSRIYQTMRKSSDPNRKGHIHSQVDRSILLELCHGYPTRGYYFLDYRLEPSHEALIITYLGHRKFKRVMEDFPPNFGPLGVVKPDTLRFISWP
ncbi:MAG TPA: hypothetical protein DCF33_09400 [Saprospirales bacterium]|nr:hypothetical protein [Saprospirales bacterium]